MHIFSLNSFIVGLALSFVVDAAPSTYGRRADLVPRGVPESAAKLRFLPRDGKKGKGGKGKDDEINIEVVDITEKISKNEVDLEIKVTDILIKNKSNNHKKDKKRKHDSKKNHNDKNVVIQVVQVIIDIRDSSNINTRYALHEVSADNGKTDTTTMMVTDAQTMTISNSTDCTVDSNGTSIAVATDSAASNALLLADGTATATALTAAPTDVGAPYLQSNQTTLYAPDTPPPAPPADGSVEADPAFDITIDIIAALGDSRC